MGHCLNNHCLCEVVMKKKLYTMYILSLLLAIYTFVGMMIKTGVYNYQLNSTGYQSMMLECCFIGVICFLSLYKLPQKYAGIMIGIIILIFSYLHVILYPVIIQIVYFGSLFCVGDLLRRVCLGNNALVDRFVINFLFGSNAVILLAMLLSCLQIGSIETIRIAWIVVAIISAGILYFGYEVKLQSTAMPSGNFSCITSITVSFLLICVLVQLGRVGLVADYDSLWYGLRPEYIYVPGNSIFEDLGLLGVVYNYQKAYETLLLPISGLSSYSFLIGANIFIGIILWVVIYRTVRVFMKKELALVCTMFCAVIPGISNMFITTKPDTMVLLMQMLMIYFTARIVKGDGEYNGYGLVSVWLFSYACKVTSIIFSSALFVILGCTVWFHKKKLRKPLWEKKSIRGFLCVIPSGVILGAFLFRTYLLTGVPMVSFARGFFTSLGFTSKDLYQTTSSASWQIGEKALHVFTPEGFLAAIEKLMYIWFLPNTGWADHVCIAWGGPVVSMFTMLNMVFFINLCLKRKKIVIEKEGKSLFFIPIGFLVILFFSLGTMIVIKKPDGNYFSLMYCMSVITFFYFVTYCTCLDQKRIAFDCFKVFSPLIVISVMFSGISGWDWWAEFYPVTLINNGRYSNQEINAKDFRTEFPQIASILLDQSDEPPRVFMIGDNSYVSTLPVVGESIEHISSYLHSAEKLKKYLEYGEKQYIFIQKDYMSASSHIADLLDELDQMGILQNEMIENGYALAEVNLEPDIVNESVETEEDSFVVKYLIDSLSGSTLGTCTIHDGYSHDHWAKTTADFTISTREEGKVVLVGEYYTPAYGGIQGTEEIKVFVNNEEIMTYLVESEDIYIEISCAAYSDIHLRLESNFSFKAAAPDTRTLSYLIYGLTGY